MEESAFLARRTVSLFLNESTAVVFSAVTDSLLLFQFVAAISSENPRSGTLGVLFWCYV